MLTILELNAEIDRVKARTVLTSNMTPDEYPEPDPAETLDRTCSECGEPITILSTVCPEGHKLWACRAIEEGDICISTDRKWQYLAQYTYGVGWTVWDAYGKLNAHQLASLIISLHKKAAAK
jgi:hypothetical protein